MSQLFVEKCRASAKTVGAAIGVSLLALQPALSQAPAVLPGKGVGRVFVGMERADVLRSLGKPKSTYHLLLKKESGLPVARQGAYTEDEWVSPQGKYHLAVIFRVGRVVQISTDNPAYVVAGNISVASPCAILRRHFPRMTVQNYVLVEGDHGDPDKITSVHVDSDNGRGFTSKPDNPPRGDDEATSYYVDDVSGGIAFEFGIPDDTSFADTVAATKPDALLIHEPNSPILPIYENFVGKKYEPSDDTELKRLRAWFRQ